MTEAAVRGRDGDDADGLSVLGRFNRAEAVASVLNNLIKWGGLFGIFYWVFRSVEALSGTTTLADIGVEVGVFAGARVGQILAWMLAAGGVGYGLLQRKLRRDVVERLHRRISSLEEGEDPKRSSSKLTPRGETRPEDIL